MKRGSGSWGVLLIVVGVVAACGVSKTSMLATDATAASSSPQRPPAPASSSASADATAIRVDTDTLRTTPGGATFLLPAGWSSRVKGVVTMVESPEADSMIALIDVRAQDADAALAAARNIYQHGAQRPLKVVTPMPNKDGWSDRRKYTYQTSPNERREVTAQTMRHEDSWTVVISDFTEATLEKRFAQVELVLGELLPKGYRRETFAGRPVKVLDAARIKELEAFLEKARQAFEIPGMAMGLIQNGEVRFAGGFGVRRLGERARVDADTLFLIASNTKALTTLMLGKMVDGKYLTWETPVTAVLPEFELADPSVTASVLVKHLVCACTGLPRQDYEWLLEFKSSTALSTLKLLSTVQPTSKFGEMYQYSNLLAAAAGYAGAHVMFPELELGVAYDRAMQTLVFDPLGMSRTTFDFRRALRENHAGGHGMNIDGRTERAAMDVNYSIVPLRPSGGAWSSVGDMLRYVGVELSGGLLPTGNRYVSDATLRQRRAPQVSMGKGETYGMGLRVDTTHGVPVVHHTGSLIGYKSGMMWLPEHGVGAVILTNSDAGRPVIPIFRRKLLEVLFDGNAEADAELVTRAHAMREQIASERKLLTVPAAAESSVELASVYTSPVLGDIRVRRGPGASRALVFDFGEWSSPVASRKHPDGTVSFITIAAGVEGVAEFTMSQANGKRTLLARDAQHEYVFTER